MTLVLPIPACSPSMRSSRLGEDSSVFSTWNTHNHGNKETTQISGGLNNNVLVKGRASSSGGEQPRTSPAIDTASLLQQLAIPKPGYTSLSPDNLVISTPARPSTPSVLPRCGTPTPVGSMCGTSPCLMGSPSSSSCSSGGSNCSSRSASPLKRKLTLLSDYAADDDCDPRPKRISPFHNTPKQRRDEKRRVLKMSIQKLRGIDDPEQFLRRSVLINNMTKRMQKELREEKRYGYGYSQTYYPSTFASYADCAVVEQDCFYSSPPAHLNKRLTSCSYMETDCDSGLSSSSSSSHLPSSPSSLACSMPSTDSLDSGPDASEMFREDSACCDEDPERPMEKLADDLSESLLRSMCDEDSQQRSSSGHLNTSLDTDHPLSSYADQDMDSCASLSDSSSEGSSPPASPPSDSEGGDGTKPASAFDESDSRQVDILWDNLLSVLTGSHHEA